VRAADLGFQLVRPEAATQRAGDEVLVRSTRAWRDALGSRGFLARYGGEEFTVLLPVLLYPSTIPVIIAGVRGTAALFQPTPDEPMARFWAALDRDVQPLDIVLIRTGRDAFLDAPDYMIKGPGVTAEATRRLYELGTRVMGIDAWGWDAPLHLEAQWAKEKGEPGVFWAAHQCDLAYSQIERLCNLGALPSSGFTVSCFPLKVVGGSAGPARVVAILDG
jgi:kynurenine formamidase